ncbi:MAG TPA: ubiquinol-cytochrome c reductase iron-sulfur subunit [Chloroflexota bacterium]|nr:ubiquinol-cytochrome c reductase iron-sulfur subunit [Chloroflexota bacterium]
MSMTMQELTRKLLTREAFLGLFTLSFGAVAGLVVGIPIIGYVLGPLIEQPPEIWEKVTFAGGPNRGRPVMADSIPIGQTEEVAFQARGPLPWAGTTATQGAWLRRTGPSSFIAYAIYCTHLGCPVHFLPQPKIFLCPCHGSVFNAEGINIGGPAPRPLFTYNIRVQNGHVQIRTHPLPVIT